MKKRKYKNSGYSGGGASTDKPTLKTYLPRSYSAKSDIELNLPLLRSRSADLAMNSALGAAAINTMLSGVLGSGLQVYPKPNYRALGMTSEQAHEWTRQVKLLFEMWACDVRADFYNRNNFLEMQRIAFTESLFKGDCFTLYRRGIPTSEYPFSLRLQNIASQRVSNPQTEGGMLNAVEMTRGHNRIVNGVEVDKNGKMLAIWVSNKIWNEPLTVTPDLIWKRVRFIGENGTRNFLHVCYDTRAEMYRGTPLLSPVIESLKQVLRYSDAELTAAIIKTFFSLFFVQKEGNFTLNEMVGDGEEPLDVGEYKLGAGTINSLPRGVDVKSINASSSYSTFEPFINTFVKEIGSALGIPAEILLKEFQSSYSASRAAILEAEKVFRQRRRAFINDFTQPVYEMFLTEAVATGEIDAPGYFESPVNRYCWSRADWRTEKNHSVDEVKEVNAAILRLQNGLSTYEQEIAELSGAEASEIIEQLKLERAEISLANPENV